MNEQGDQTIPSHSASDVPRSQGTPGATVFDPSFLTELRHQMVCFARLQLSDPHVAEDTVHEALIAAMENAASFEGRSAFKTWVFAILKNKIADELRRKQRLTEVRSSSQCNEEEDDFSDLFDRHGFWLADRQPRRWENPESALHDTQFWQIFEACLDHLPPAQAQVFMMREFLELEASEVCAAVGITLNHLYVMLHRARMRLRRCLEEKWFQRGSPC